MDFLSKKEVRRFMIDKRDAVNIEKKQELDEKIFETLINSRFYKKAAVIFTFVSFRSEADTYRFINHAILDKKVVCVPKIKSKQEGMEAFKISDLSDLKEGYFGVQEPSDKCPRVDIGDIDLIVMPGLAFDREGGRIGYGGGFYDAFISKLDRRVYKIAIAYNFQVLDKVPVDDWDIRVDGVITDKEIILIDRHCSTDIEVL